jgi:hypothetical protein
LSLFYLYINIMPQQGFPLLYFLKKKTLPSFEIPKTGNGSGVGINYAPAPTSASHGFIFPTAITAIAK